MLIHGINFPSVDFYTTDGISEEPPEDLFSCFFKPLSQFLRRQLSAAAPQLPHINYQIAETEASRLLGTLTPEQLNDLKRLKLWSNNTDTAAWAKDPVRVIIQKFLWLYPHFANALTNCHLYAQVCVRASELHLGESISPENFVAAKAYIDQLNRLKWTREQNTKERQSGVSNLGSISELLLEKALSEFIDNKNFFKINNSKVKSYGDFVLVSLPNNLWISVKSNFARERLLASGFTTDIIGVGFFTDSREFTSSAKLRNFQRVGFLAMYIPDLPITQEQQTLRTSTYQQIIDAFNGEENLPRNINGTHFIRRLSQLHLDIEGLLSTSELTKRTTINY